MYTGAHREDHWFKQRMGRTQCDFFDARSLLKSSKTLSFAAIVFAGIHGVRVCNATQQVHQAQKLQSVPG